MNCIGINAFSGSGIDVSFHDAIQTVRPAAAAEDVYLAPGWIDLQVNGFAGVDFNDPHTGHEEMARSIGVLFSTGVTRFYPTVITGAPEEMEGALRNLARARESLADGEAMDGFHVEGPFISGEDGPRGAHPRQWVRRPDFDEYRRWQDATGGHVRIVTLAPEWPGAMEAMERMVSAGTVVSIGHTQASRTQIADAVSAGATLSTHLGNGAHPLLRRHPNYIWDQLAEDRLMADFIADGIHLDASFLKVAIRAKTVDRSVLVTDAATPAGAAPGRYRMGGVEIELLPEGRVVLASEDRLAGSALRMDRGVENLMKLAGISLADAVRMATTNAARAGAVAGRTGGLVPGDRADLVKFRMQAGHIEVLETWISGRKVWRG